MAKRTPSFASEDRFTYVNSAEDHYSNNSDNFANTSKCHDISSGLKAS